MANDNEPAKLLLPYLQRADELQKHDPLVAYYCRLYAMERGLKFPQSERTKTTNNLLVSLMKQLEKDKKSLKLGPDDQLHLEGFALNVFEKADKQDRAGRANLNTAKTFYAASIFFEILNQFGELQPDLEQKQKYAAWKAADIRKAIKEGRAPVPGPPGGEDNFSLPTNTSSGEYDVEPSTPDPAIKSAPVQPPPQFYDEANHQNTADISPPPPSNRSPPAPPSSYPSSGYPLHDIHPSQNARSAEDASYPQTYHHQPYPQDPSQQFPQNYPSHEAPSSYPNFQSYPSFTESSLPTAPSHYPSYYQGSDSSYPNPDSAKYNSQNSFVTSHNESAQYNSQNSFGTAHNDSAQYNSQNSFGTAQNESAQYNSQNSFGTRHDESPPPPSKLNHHVSAPAATIASQHLYASGNSSVPAPAQPYKYDSNYQPAPDKIAEAHKAARFAVGALAFDDVATAVDFLSKSLELLTNPAAGN